MDSRAFPPLPSDRPWLPRILRLAYTHNPFYLLSAGLVLYGLHLAGWARGSWTLLAILGGYAALLAAVGVLVVRLGKVWDDARSILLIVVVLLLAASVAFDDITVEQPRRAAAILLVGLGLAIGLSEALLAGLAIRFPLALRLPYHAALGLFFLYPILLSRVVEIVHAGNKPLLSWALYGWPVAAGLLFLGLLPAVRRGPEVARGSGTPWPWPAFPWVLFALLAAAVGLRTWIFCNSYYTGWGAHDPFAAWLLAPFLLVLGLLLLEAGLQARHRGLQTVALFVPALVLLLSFPGADGNKVRQELLLHVRVAAGAPVWIAALGAIAFYLVAWARRVRAAEWGLVGAMAVFAVVGRETLAPDQVVLRSPQLLPLVAMGLFLLARLRWVWSSWRALAGLACLAWAAASLAPGLGAWRHGLAWMSAAAALSLALGLIFDDRLARVLRRLVRPLLAAALVAALFLAHALAPGWPAWTLWPYAVLLAVSPLLLGLAIRSRGLLAWQALHLALFALKGSAAIVELHRQPELPGGTLPLFWSGVCLAIAVGISLVKAGMLHAALARLGRSPRAA